MNEEGSMLPFMAALILVGLIVVGLALDVALFAAMYREAAFSADVGAEAGASALAASYEGDLVLDPVRAEAAAADSALSARPRAGRSVATMVETSRICVTVTEVYRPRILSAIGVAPTEITVEACAEPRRG